MHLMTELYGGGRGKRERKGKKPNQESKIKKERKQNRNSRNRKSKTRARIGSNVKIGLIARKEKRGKMAKLQL